MAADYDPCAAQTGTRHRGNHEACRPGRRTIHKIIPASELAAIVDNIGLTSAHQMAYNNSEPSGRDAEF